MLYYLMRKNEEITLAQFSPNGEMESFNRELLREHIDIAPFEVRSPKSSLIKWWNDRAVPVGQGGVREMLRKNGCTTPSEFLIRNLGLSLTDYYWIRPTDSDLTWEQVNLYDNDFGQNRFESSLFASSPAKSAQYSPNSSLQGQIEKTWAMIGGERYLVKGNHSDVSRESLNEVFASLIHKRQGYDNFTPYRLIHIKNKPYEYGCCSRQFTDERKELVSAYAVILTGKRRNDQSYKECLIETLGNNGMDTKQLRKDLDYEIMTDFLLSGYDRHLTNIALLRDADTLQFTRMAPIFDSGGCLYAGIAFPNSESELLRLRTAGFNRREEPLVKSVRDYGCVDLTRLPAVSELRALYAKDRRIDPYTIEHVGIVYEKKIDLCRELQLGRHIYAKISLNTPKIEHAEKQDEPKDFDDILMTVPEPEKHGSSGHGIRSS